MPLTFTAQSESRLPVDVRQLTPDMLVGRSVEEIHELPIGLGNVSTPVSSCFEVSGEVSGHLVFKGKLSNVHHVGHAMRSGFVEVHGDAGSHIGDSMCGGELVVHGSVSDFAGFEMRGGTLVVHGDAGDHVGGCYPGAKHGMNRGTILIDGNAGEGVGYRMRRGTIVVVGDSGAHLGWQMRAGTIAIIGLAKQPIGVDMKRGTIVVNRFADGKDFESGSSFGRGMTGRMPVISMMMKRVRSLLSNYRISASIEEPGEVSSWHGDQLSGCRGEVFRILN